MEYYDMLIVGKTGCGKSTLANKLIIANPSNCDYHGEQHSSTVLTNGPIVLEDLSLWMISDSEGEMEKHLKRLVWCRSLDNPHNEVNKMYGSFSESTNSCQLISNETTKIRILDTPGFFGEFGRDSEVNSEKTSEGVAASGLAIMREVLRVQATMHMNFKRVVYFLPERGPLERSQKALQIELEQMAYYFGKSIFDCMVLVATVSPEVYQFISPDVIPFSQNDYAKTKKNFRYTIEHILPKNVKLPDGKPPVVFISMHDTCEDTLRKIKDAPVITDGMELEYHQEGCTHCGIKAKVLGEGEKKVVVACYVDQDPSNSIPYEESLCHPVIIPKYWKFTRTIGGIAHMITRNKYRGKWRDFNNPDDEICIDCREVPGTRGCRMINTKYKFSQSTRAVDHHWVLNEQEEDSAHLHDY